MTSIHSHNSIRFTSDDLACFGEASHDYNPLHRSASYARKTPYGEQLVFGMLGVLACLSKLDLAPDLEIAQLSIDFPQPLFVGIDYCIELAHTSATQLSARIVDGRRVLLKLSASLAPAAPAPAPASAQPDTSRRSPADLQPADLTPQRAVSGSYAPSWDAFAPLAQRLGLGADACERLPISALLWASYLIGMELPGLRALFAGAALDFQAPARAASAGFAYQARVVRLDQRFGLLTLNAQLSAGQVPFAHVRLRSFLRPDSPAAPRAAAPASPLLASKVALVIGASRGLGATISSALAQHGCTVLANYQRSADDAAQLQASLSEAPGRVQLLQGDGADPSWCQTARQQIEHDYGRLDLLICCACPAILPLWIEPAAVARINAYIGASLALVSVPMASFLDLLEHTGGCAAVISSSAVLQPPAEWPHYVSAKYAIEGLVRAAAAEYGGARFIIARPPRLQTDLTNTPLGRQGALAPAGVAAHLIDAFAHPAPAGHITLLSEFAGSYADEDPGPNSVRRTL